MRRTLRTFTVLAALLTIGVLWAGTAAATPEQVLADQADNGIIDGAYSPDDLNAAISLAKERAGAQTQASIAAIRDAQARELFGADQGDGTPSPDAAGPEPSPSETLPPVLRLPEAPVVEPGTTVPVAFVILSVVAALMVLAGIGASTFRRVTRPSPGVAGSR